MIPCSTKESSTTFRNVSACHVLLAPFPSPWLLRIAVRRTVCYVVSFVDSPAQEFLRGEPWCLSHAIQAPQATGPYSSLGTDHAPGSAESPHLFSLKHLALKIPKIPSFCPHVSILPIVFSFSYHHQRMMNVNSTLPA